MKFNTVQIIKKGPRNFSMLIDDVRIQGVKEVETSMSFDSLSVVRVEFITDDIYIETPIVEVKDDESAG